MVPSSYDFDLKYPPQVHSSNAWLLVCGAILKTVEPLGGVVCRGEADYEGWDLVIFTSGSCNVNYPLPPTPLPQTTLMSLLQWTEITSHSNLFLLPVASIRYFVLSWEKQGTHVPAPLSYLLPHHGFLIPTLLIPFSRHPHSYLVPLIFPAPPPEAQHIHSFVTNINVVGPFKFTFCSPNEHLSMLWRVGF